MPEAGRVLPFRVREAARPVLSAEDSRGQAKAYLATAYEKRTEALIEATLTNADCLLALCAELKERCDSQPALIFDEASRLYRWVESNASSLGLFDERDYFLGEAALAAGGAARLLGKRDEADCWYDLAEAGFRHTVNPGPLLANVAYARLSLYYDRRQYQRVFDLLPSLTASYRKLGMSRERLKCEFLAAMALKECSKTDQALARLQAMRADTDLSLEPDLEVLAVLHYGDLLSAKGQFAEAFDCLSEVSTRPAVKSKPLISAHLKSAMGEALRQQGLLPQAAIALHAAAEEYSAAGMATLEAYLRIVLAETLIALSRHREAEWHIAAALPTVEEQKMVPEAVAAVTLLRESVARRQADPAALRTLREHLQVNS